MGVWGVFLGFFLCFILWKLGTFWFCLDNTVIALQVLDKTKLTSLETFWQHVFVTSSIMNVFCQKTSAEDRSWIFSLSFRCLLMHTAWKFFPCPSTRYQQNVSSRWRLCRFSLQGGKGRMKGWRLCFICQPQNQQKFISLDRKGREGEREKGRTYPNHRSQNINQHHSLQKTYLSHVRHR